jgi:hypothetical protein
MERYYSAHDECEIRINHIHVERDDDEDELGELLHRNEQTIELYPTEGQDFHSTWDAEGGIYAIAVTTKIVCPRCRGNGKIVNPNVDGHGITQEEFDEDPDFKDNYFSGVYDITCPQCKGRNVVDELDQENNPKWLLDIVEQREYERYADERMRRMESGYYLGY